MLKFEIYKNKDFTPIRPFERCQWFVFYILYSKYEINICHVPSISNNFGHDNKEWMKWMNEK